MRVRRKKSTRPVAIFVVASAAGVDREWALGISVLIGVVVRGIGIRYGISLPSFRERESANYTVGHAAVTL